MSTSAERQRRFVENNQFRAEELRAKHAACQRRSYYKKRSKLAGTESVAERKTLKQATLKPDTIRRKAKDQKQQTAALATLQHYKLLLFNAHIKTRQVGIAWFRVAMGCDNPYVMLSIPLPVDFDPMELKRDFPSSWRFHRYNLLENYHPNE